MLAPPPAAVTVYSGGTPAIELRSADQRHRPIRRAIQFAFGYVQTVSSGQTVSNFDPVSGGTLKVLAGGSALATTISAGGSETLTGTDSGAIVDNGRQIIFSGGHASAAIVRNGGSQTVSSAVSPSPRICCPLACRRLAAPALPAAR